METNMPPISAIVFPIIAILAISAKSTLACGMNEQLGNCGRICEGTCNKPDLSRCAATTCSGNGCQCKEGYLRNEETDSCIPPSMCPPKTCKGNEILGTCGTRCEGTCEYPYTPEMCSIITCADEDCRCDLDSGFVRDTNTGRCIAMRDCPR
ncbi:serine protease inhibitor swm-1-like [Venturia canescens]|uniref:serine protease inhibitor swm-1-like n=1 Tax=Venturia canescens TaxID=32260 RepID=UPI001C9D34DF|nr:serine protease inhibitor swm-1-like [Venturia canescens]